MTQTPAGRAAGDTAANGSSKITREVVLAAALEIIDRDGADGLSMRRLARALGRDPMILYRHAPNKAALLDGVAETVLAQLKVDSADRDWATQLRAVARRCTTGSVTVLGDIAQATTPWATGSWATALEHLG